MSQSLESFGPNFEIRDGKIYYVGPVRKSEILMPNDGLTPEQRGEAFDKFCDGLTDYDFDAWRRLRELERNLKNFEESYDPR